MAVLRNDTLAVRAPPAYQADAARHGIRFEAALWLAEELRGVSPEFRPTTQGQLQEELERQAAALGEDIRQLRALLAADRKRAIKDFWLTSGLQAEWLSSAGPLSWGQRRRGACCQQGVGRRLMGVSGRRKEDSMQEHPSETLKDRTRPNHWH